MSGIGVYFCNCGTIVTDKIDPEKVKEKIAGRDGVAYFKACSFMCSAAGKEEFEADIKAERPERVVIAACSPRDHEKTFMNILERSGINPYLMQMVNIREQVAWVTEDPVLATRKAMIYINGAISRVKLHDPLEKKKIDVSTDVLIIGAGPAGLKAALTLAEAGRRVTLVEKSPALGGTPVRYDEVAPLMECAPCMLTPLMEEATTGNNARNIELLTQAVVEDLVGFYGNFTVTIRQQPRFVAIDKCIGCMACVEPCPVSTKNQFNFGLNDRKAIDFPFLGALPNAPYLDPETCIRFKGEPCTICLDACPVPETVLYDQQPRRIEKQVGAVIVAIGSRLYDCAKLPNLGYKTLPDVVTSIEFERLLAGNGPNGGDVVTSTQTGSAGGKTPTSVAIIHCVGSLDKNHVEYCSGICCQSAFKYNHRLAKKAPGAKVHHLYKEISIAGKDEASLYHHARENPDASFIRYNDIRDINVAELNGSKEITVKNTNGETERFSADMVVLCAAIVPHADTAGLSEILDARMDRHGFFAELHGRMDSAQSAIRGIYLGGSCQGPMDIQKAINSGMASTGYILSGLVEGKQLEIEPITACVDEERCSGCRVCVNVCPYSAISFIADKEVSRVNSVLCEGCGTCVAACPAGAIKGNHFSNAEIMAEMESIFA